MFSSSGLKFDVSPGVFFDLPVITFIILQTLANVSSLSIDSFVCLVLACFISSVTLFLSFLYRISCFPYLCFASSLSFIRFLISWVIWDGTLFCLTLFCLIGACLSTTGKNSEYQVSSASSGLEHWYTGLNETWLRSYRNRFWSKCLNDLTFV